MLKKRVLSLCRLALVCLLPISAIAQQSTRFRQDNDAIFRAKDAADNQLYGIAAMNARESLEKPLSGVRTHWSSEQLAARYITVLSGLKTNEPGAVDSAKSLVASTNDQPVRDRISLAIARYYFIHGMLAAAIPYYEQASIANLNNVEIADAKFELAYCYFNNRQFEQANTLFSIMKEVPGRYYSAGNYYYGLLAYTKGEYTAALKSFDRIKDEPVYRPVVPYYVAEIYYFMGDREKALAEAMRLIALPEKLYYDNELHLLAAQCLFEAGRYGDALPYFEHYYEHTDKVRKEELYEMGYAYYRVNEWKSAIEKFKPLSAAQDSLGQTAMYLLGDCYLKAGNKENARNAFGICASMPFNPGQREAALLLYAKLSYETGYSDDAMRSVRTLLSDFPGSPYTASIRMLQSQLYLETNSFKDAYEAVTAAGTGFADIGRIRQRAAYGYALQQWQAGKIEDADLLLGKSLEDPVAADYTAAAQFWKAEASYRLHEFDSAVYYDEQFLSAMRSGAEKVSPAATPAHASLTLGYALMEQKEYARAQAAFAQAKSGTSGSLAATATLRQADAYFMQKDFAKAAPLYLSVSNGNGADADYARLQSAIIAGLRGDDAEKGRLLQSISGSSPYATEARYELGVADIAAGRFEAAITNLSPLAGSRSAGAFAPKALLKIGTAEQQLNRDDSALATYRTLLRNYPSSPEHIDALAAAKSIYIERNQPDAYATLLKEFNMPQASDEELEAAYYNAAEVQYAAGKWKEAAQAFRRYLDVYPTGTRAAKARYYLATSLYTSKAFTAARVAYDTILQNPWSNYSEESANKAAELAVADTAWNDAGRYYSMLAQHAATNATRLKAYTGLMRTATKTGNTADAARYADTLLLSYEVPQPVRDEATMNTIRRDHSNGGGARLDSLLKPLTESENGAVAAEARYRLASNLFSEGKVKEAEALAGTNIKKAAGYEYWLVKTYLLLGDIMVAEHDYFNARATYQSVLKNTSIPELRDYAQRKLDEIKGQEKSKLSNE